MHDRKENRTNFPIDILADWPHWLENNLVNTCVDHYLHFVVYCTCKYYTEINYLELYPSINHILNKSPHVHGGLQNPQRLA